MTPQPQWKYVANLGDVGFLDYGGFFVFVDETGAYDPEAEILEIDNESEQDEEKLRYTVYRFVLEPCTFVNGVLSDNRFHPNYAVWFADDLAGIASSSGASEEELIAGLCSEDAVKRAMAYREIVGHFGPHEFDSYPLHMGRTEAAQRYKGIKR